MAAVRSSVGWFRRFAQCWENCARIEVIFRVQLKAVVMDVIIAVSAVRLRNL